MALGNKRMQKNLARRDPFSWIHLQHVCYQLDKTIFLAFTCIFVWHVFTQLMWDETEIVRKWTRHQIELDFLKCPTMLRKSRVLCGMKLTFSISVFLCKMNGLVRYVRNTWRNEAMIGTATQRLPSMSTGHTVPLLHHFCWRIAWYSALNLANILVDFQRRGQCVLSEGTIQIWFTPGES